MEASDNIEKILQNNFNIEDNLSFEDVEKFADYIKNNNKNVNNILLQFESITSQFEKELENIQNTIMDLSQKRDTITIKMCNYSSIHNKLLSMNTNEIIETPINEKSEPKEIEINETKEISKTKEKKQKKKKQRKTKILKKKILKKNCLLIQKIIQ